MGKSMTTDDANSLLAHKLSLARQPRAIHTFQFSKSIRDVFPDYQSVGLVELRLDEEETVAQLNRGRAPGHLGWELSKAAVVEVNGQKVTDADDSKEMACAKMPSKIRAHVVGAYNKIHLPDDKEVEGFLESEEVRI